VDWYMPFVRGQKNDNGLTEGYLEVWRQIESRLPPCPQAVLHIDFHPDNLMWLDKRKQCGVLDYQGAMRGPLPYDIANLLEDARFYMPQDQRDVMRGLYCGLMQIEGEEKENFELWYRVLATQFHCRVIGQFIKIALTSDHAHYLDFIPVLSRYLQEGLGHPVLWPLKKWFQEMRVPFDSDFKPDLTLSDKIVAAQAF